MTEQCRLCGQMSNDLQSVFSFAESGRLLADLIYIVCPIRVEVSDDLPKKICEVCKEIIVTSVELRELSVRSDLTFRKKNVEESDGPSSSDPIDIKHELDEDWDTFGDEALVELQQSAVPRGKN